MRKLLLILTFILLPACADIGYYWHSTKGHISIMNKRVDIDDLLNTDSLDDNLRQRLVLVQEIRAFSITALKLPDSGSYSSYVELDKPYVLKNLFAAPEFSTNLLSWCYPIVGCASYRGYYDEKMLNEFISNLDPNTTDIYVGKVPAYSTLGWFDDPVLSSFIYWPDYRLAGLLFHELTHQRLYIDNDTQFNESLASAVQQVGSELWLSSKNKFDELEDFRQWIKYRHAVVELIEKTRANLAQLYQSNLALTDKRLKKKTILDAAVDEHTKLATSMNIQAGFKNWFAHDLNNAKLASISAYNKHVLAFVAILTAFENDFERFFDYLKTISNLDKSKRSDCLKAWQEFNALEDTRCI